MKINSRKLLLFLHSPDLKTPFVGKYEYFDLLFPELSPGGRRSLIHHLLKLGYLTRQAEGREVGFLLSSIGKQWVEQFYAGIFSLPTGKLPGEQQVCVVLKPATSSSPARRQLQYLLEQQGGQVGGVGVYFLP